MISRRRLLILAGSAAAATLTGINALAGEEKEEHVVDPNVPQWAMVVDIDKCTECMEELIEKTKEDWHEIKPPCVVACDTENNVPEFENKRIDPQWLKILKVRNELEGSKELYVPLLCNHCRHPACAQVCLTKATFVRKDGIVMIDFHRCIGCRYCIVACPYNARTFNFKDPLEGLDHINPKVPRRSHGVPEKCTFCVHRIDEAMAKGEEPIPACVEACPYNALVFGNLNDPNSEVAKIVRTSKVIQLRANLGTNPRVYYLM
ncbi:sulfate reduction electron transfer complex DsrMKJOP subunit DsrO [Archaeoglobus veneficus]|uniref:4Fe-4S ferredoxin iron-sulfur binding domain-containing protein n=1 Tax=Archaeoglobus veneficus (strain DSM 11195 / SNP6) TaxID=693661 RepID=F2KQF7_ARCVS|nr:4Fe-4S dicluster domain-containing protein [Archaeoglobus veneficus]AEA47690.1 4Fe-4S ferredoxin iron-sulfur binding domain-containing protein [Archaeoglobus veneficus SNP6]